jgi:hypothetical protein
VKTLSVDHRTHISTALRKAPSRLPKFLVQRLGEERVKELIGIPPGSWRVRKRSTHRKVAEWVKRTDKREFFAAMIAKDCNLQCQQAASVLGWMRRQDNPEVMMIRKESGTCVWGKVPA